MNIKPYPSITTLNSINSIKNQVNKSDDSKKSEKANLFSEAIDNVKETAKAVENDSIKLATGNADDLHNIMINSTKATMSVELLVELRNKCLEAYNEIMKTNL